MSISITGVTNSKYPNTEYITLRVTNNDAGNLQEYLIHDNTYDSSGKPTNKVRHIYFFPKTVPLRAGDTIYLYTGNGTNAVNPKRINDEKLTFRFYWGLKECVWNDDGDIVHLLKHKSIDTHII